jgi:hypothetical protein
MPSLDTSKGSYAGEIGDSGNGVQVAHVPPDAFVGCVNISIPDSAFHYQQQGPVCAIKFKVMPHCFLYLYDIFRLCVQY